MINLYLLNIKGEDFPTCRIYKNKKECLKTIKIWNDIENKRSTPEGLSKIENPYYMEKWTFDEKEHFYYYND